MRSLIVILCLIASTAFGQSREIEAKVDTNLGQIGEQIQFQLHLKTEVKDQISWPVIKDSLGKLEIIKLEPIDTIQNGSWTVYQQNIIVTSFDSGYFKIPNLEIGINSGKAYSNEVVVRFNDVPVEANKVMDIKEPLSVPPNYMQYVLYGLLGLTVLGLIIWYFFLRPKKEQAEIAVPKVIIPPHVEALEALTELHKEKAWEQIDQNKAYYTSLTLIVWTYLERQFNIHTFERTSDEIIDEVERVQIIGSHLKENIASLLKHADMIKFAKASSSPLENEQHLENMIKLVKATIPSPKVIEENE